MLKEFKKFAMQGNVVDLAVGVIIGGAFGKIVSSFVEDILMPPIGLLLGNADFSNLFINLSAGSYETISQAQEAGAVTINYGLFINTVIDFLIVAGAIFIMVRQLRKLEKKDESEQKAPTTKPCPFCKTEIALEATRCPACTSRLE